MCRLARLVLMVFGCLAMIPVTTYAQGSIVGTAKDTSGAVLPGVTVEAASPALIEKVRSAVTDGTGQYRIENLRPGLYTVTFTLPGFSVVKREGIELSGSFVASVNGELRVGSLEETITVTGESPIVDVQSTTRQRVLNQEVLDVLPAGRVLTSLAGVTPGITSNRDVGGNLGDGVGAGGLQVRGVSDARVLVGGVVSSTTYRVTQGAPNVGAFQEMTIDTGGADAEQEFGGVHVNVIFKDGGNTFRGSFLGALANDAMAGNNFTQELKDRGLSTPDSLKQLLDINPSFGGPIKRDRVWFNVSARYSRAWNFSPVFFNKNAGNPNVWTYEPDLNKGPAWNENTLEAFTARVTWQATEKHKLSFTYDPSEMCDCPRALTARVSPEANVTNHALSKPQRTLSGQWTAPVSNRFLLEANIQSLHRIVERARVNPYFAPSPVPLIKVVEQSTGLSYRGTPNARLSENKLLYWRAVASYVTGAHAFKAGFLYGEIPNDTLTFTVDAPIEYRFNNGVPNRLTLHATPFTTRADLDADHGLFVQDRWTMKRVTMTGGLRYTFLRIKFPETVVGPGAWTPNRRIVTPDTAGATWHDLSPRSSVAVDVFGNGKTALKVSLNHYLTAQDRSTIFGEGMSPTGVLVVSTTRSWADANANFVPDCNLTDPARNGECGAMANPNFGSAVPGLSYDPDPVRGWGKRKYNWQFAVGVQQEILPRVSLDVGYWRTWFGNFETTYDRALKPSDYDAFSITAPVDPRLPGGGGYVVSGLYDLKPEKFGLPANGHVTFAGNFGKQIEHWNGVDVTLNARPRAGVLLQGGTSTSRQSTNTCEVVQKLNNPSTLFCDVPGTFLTQVKLLGSYLVPRIDVQVTASVQNLPGPEITAQYIVSNAQVRSSLGRDLAGGASNVTVNLIAPRSMYGERMNQLDLRIGKILRFGRTRATLSLDLYNALNSNAVLDQSTAFANWQTPEEILPARFAKVVMQFDF